MRPITITLAVIMLSIAGTALGGEEHEVFDQALAAEPGADEYGMRGCVMAFLKAGADRDQPAVQAGRLVMELHPWYGSAALMKFNEFHPRIARQLP